MRLTNTEMTGLLTKQSPTPSTTTKPPRVKAQRCGRDVARSNELRCMKAIAQYGHLRIVELARSVWPTARYGEQVARRTIRRLVEQGLLLERRNALASTSLCVTRAGAAWLELRGVTAQHTLDLSSVGGPTFFHRTMATRYLIERQLTGAHVAGEYRILRRDLPFNIDALARAMRKLPDGLVWQRRPDGTVGVELVEQEAAPKARAEIEKCLRAVEFVGTRLPGDAPFTVAGLVFVFDRDLNHARRLLLAANSLWGARPASERVTLEQRVKLVAVELREPLVWVGSSVTTLHELRQRGI
ncbi:MAG: hypothetical protein JSR69_21825 [Proteobacteria bacterium]|nr:hypothetical protein [Pseudomonadota bacterium]